MNFLNDKRLQGIAVKFFFPTEIVDEVFAVFPGKVISRAVFLRWRSEDLIAMLARRFLTILTQTKALPSAEIKELDDSIHEARGSQGARRLREHFWYRHRLLPTTITNRKGEAEDCFAYLFRHTHRRPRDVITQMQSVINVARDRGEFPAVSPTSVVTGVHNRTSLLQIVGDALIPYEGYLPGDLVSTARAMCYGRPHIMRGRELRNFARELYNLYPLDNVGPELFVKLLLRCGVIGLLEEGRGRGTYSIGRFEYLMQGGLPLSDRFIYCVHPAMADLFEMSRDDEYGVIYPMPEEGLWLEQAAGIARSQPHESQHGSGVPPPRGESS